MPLIPLDVKRSPDFHTWNSSDQLEAHPESHFIAISYVGSPLFSMFVFPKKAFPDGPLGACPRIRRGRAHGACEASSRREEEAMSMHIVDDEQRRDPPQSPCALRVPAPPNSRTGS